jgi:HD-like signal output (HDOD) protein
LPAAALRVLQLTNSEQADSKALAELIAQDPALSVRILRAVNSPFYGMSHKVSSVPQAVALLGVHSVKTLVLGFTLVNALHSHRPGEFDHFAYWRRSMYSAAAARVIASQVCSYLTEECFITALLMDIGTLVLSQLLENQYGSLYDRAATHQDLMVLEQHELGLTHAEAGQMLARTLVPAGKAHDPDRRASRTQGRRGRSVAQDRAGRVARRTVRRSLCRHEERRRIDQRRAAQPPRYVQAR